MGRKSDVTKFFEDNARRINLHSDPVSHNTNAGLLALVNYLSGELVDIQARLSQLHGKVAGLEKQLHSVRPTER